MLSCAIPAGGIMTRMSSILPMIGVIDVTTLEVAVVSIHGDLYHDLLVAPVDASGQIKGEHGARVRLPAHLCPRPPRVGDRLTLRFLMGQVNGVTFAKP